MPEIFLGARVLPLENLLGEGHAALAGLRLDELQELLTGEVPGMRRHKVEETCLFLGIAKAAQGVDVDRKEFHSAKILAVISCESSTRRNLSWSCGRANRWKPAFAFSPRPWGR